METYLTTAEVAFSFSKLIYCQDIMRGATIQQTR